MTKPPVAKKIEHKTTVHQEVLVDDYFWLRDDNYPNVSPEVMDYLQEENKYSEVFHDKFKLLEEQFFTEMKSRIVEDDISWPVKIKKYEYFTQVKAGLNHPIYFRKALGRDDEVQLLVDPNRLAGESKSFSLGDLEISKCQKLMAFSFDMVGKERYVIQVQDTLTGEIIDDIIEDTSGGDVMWNAKSTGFFYLKLDDKWRLNRLYYHKLGTKQHEDILIYYEKDEMFRLSLDQTSDDKYLLLYSSSSTSSECYYLPLDNLSAKLEKIYDRKNDHLVAIDHQDGFFYLKLNDVEHNFRLVKFPVDHVAKINWQEVIAESSIGYITDFYMIKGYMIVTAKKDGIEDIYIYQHDQLYYKIPFNEKSYEVEAVFTEYEADFVRIEYNSMITPLSVFEFEIAGKNLLCKKVKNIPGYDPDLYEYDRILAPSRENGVMIPISIIYRKNMQPANSPQKMLLYGYGSYGIGISTSFNPNVFSLVDRGYYYAIAHIRGGDDLGFNWYEQAKFLNKKRTFNDFIDVSEYLIEKKYTSPQQLSIIGGSAGGMLVGVVINERPELYKSALALVPFVDVLHTMLDENLPLTPGEFKEWGNPGQDKEYFDYIRSYSPYDNVKRQAYPNILVTAGINDPRVTYWEPAKWVAKLRSFKTDDNLLLFRTELEQGHKGAIGRYDRVKEYAFYYAFTDYCQSI